MVKKIFPLLLIIFLWLIFSKPFFLENKLPYPSNFQVNHFSLWQEYSKYWYPIKNPAMPDVTSQIMPWKKFTIDSYKKGEIPFWNPYSFSGNPHLANYQSGVFSVSNLFYFIFDFKTAWGFAILLAPLLAGIFTYIFSRSLKTSEFGSLVSAVSLMFSGFIITWLSWGTLSLALSFLPLALFAVQKYFDSQKFLYLIILAFSIPLSFFSGHFQISLYFLAFVLIFTLFRYYETKNFKSSIHIFSFIGIGLLLSMPQILPSIEFYFQAFRSSIFEKIDAIPLIRLPVVIAPDFYGNPVTRNNFLGNYGEWSSFAGVIPFLLAIFAVFKNKPQTTFFAITAILALLLCVDSPIADILIKLQIPVISTSSLSRVLGIFIFSIAILSGLGFDFLVKKIKEKDIKSILIWLFLCSIIFFILWIIIIGKIIDERFYQIAMKNLILPSAMMIGLIFAIAISIFKTNFLKITILIIVFLTAIDMLRFSTKWQPFEAKDFTFPTTPIISKLSSLDTTYRFIAPFGAEGAVYYNLPITEGYDPLYINRYGEFLGTLRTGEFSRSDRLGTNLPTSSKYSNKVVNFLGIKYILLKRRDRFTVWSFPFKKYPEHKFNLIHKEKDYFIYENKNVFPRAFLTGNYVVEGDNKKIMKIITSENFDIRNNVILEKNPKIKTSNNLEGNTNITKYSPNEIRIKTESSDNSILVLSDNFYPGWKATINGKETEILRVNYSFRGVVIPKGTSEIVFSYFPKSFKFGLYLFIIGLVSLFIFSVGKWYTTKKWNKHKIAKSATK